jgi:hypothetical protein
MKYYTMLISIPCVQEKGEDRCFECLETLIQDRISSDFLQEQYEQNGYTGEYKSFEYSLSDALYRIYEEDALPYLSNEYKEQHDIHEKSL